LGTQSFSVATKYTKKGEVHEEKRSKPDLLRTLPVKGSHQIESLLLNESFTPNQFAFLRVLRVPFVRFVTHC
jgi:hypothetical protein